MRKTYRYLLSEEQKYIIYTMLMGPYEESWYNSDGIVENSDVIIGERLGINKTIIDYYTGEVTRARFAFLNKLRNTGVSEDNIAKWMKRFDDRKRGFKI